MIDNTSFVPCTASAICLGRLTVMLICYYIFIFFILSCRQPRRRRQDIILLLAGACVLLLHWRPLTKVAMLYFFPQPVSFKQELLDNWWIVGSLSFAYVVACIAVCMLLVSACGCVRGPPARVSRKLTSTRSTNIERASASRASLIRPHRNNVCASQHGR